MWFGTEDGLNRFDGYEFRQLRHDRADVQSLPNGWISSLVPSEDGLWIGTDGGGVVFRSVQTGKLSSPAQLRDSPDLQRVRGLSRDSLGRIWIASRDAGVAIFDPRTGELKRLRHSPTEPQSLSDNSVFTILSLRNGNKLIGTATGLDKLTAANLEISRVALPRELVPPGQPLRVRALTESADGMVWVGTDNGLGRYDPRNDRWRVYRQDPSSSGVLPDNRVQALLIDSQGRLWVGLIQGLAWFDAATETFSSYHRDPVEGRSLPDDYIVSLFEDRGGSLWIGTKSAGLAKWNPAHLVVRPYARQQRGRFQRSQHHLVRRGQARSPVDRNLRQRHQPAGSRQCEGQHAAPRQGQPRLTQRRPRHGDAREQRRRHLGRHHGWRTEPHRSAHAARRSIPARPGRPHDARGLRRHEPARGRQTNVGRHLWWRHLALRLEHPALREPARRPGRWPAPVERARHRAGARPYRARVDRHRRRRPQCLGRQDAPHLLLQARRQAARLAERRHDLLASWSTTTAASGSARAAAASIAW